MKNIRFKKLRLWLVYPVFFVYPLVADMTDLSFLMGMMFMVAGMGLRFWASGYIQKSRVLATSGPYAYTRNPLYLGNFIIGFGIVIISNSPGLIFYYVISFTILYLGTIYEEQKSLTEKFTDDYMDYLNEVPVFLPSYKAYRKTKGHKFDIRQSFKNGEFIRLCGFSLLIVFFYLWFVYRNGIEDFPGSRKFAIFLFLVFFALLWFNIVQRRRRNKHEGR